MNSLKKFLDYELEKAEISHKETLRRHREFMKEYRRIKRKYSK